jgi:hypothetical protein
MEHSKHGLDLAVEPGVVRGVICHMISPAYRGYATPARVYLLGCIPGTETASLYVEGVYVPETGQRPQGFPVSWPRAKGQKSAVPSCCSLPLFGAPFGA